jgi:hypothetical protein
MSNDLRLNNYLARIGFGGTVGADLATLAAIHAAHVNATWQAAQPGGSEGFSPFEIRPSSTYACRHVSDNGAIAGKS